MEEDFYDSLDEDSFCDCQSECNESIDGCTLLDECNQDEEEEGKDEEDLTAAIPLYLQEIPKKMIDEFKNETRRHKERRKPNKTSPPVKDKKPNKSYLNLFYSKIKYPCIGGGDVMKWTSGSDTTRAQYDPSSRKSSAASTKNCEYFPANDELSSDDDSFYGKLIAEEEIAMKNSEAKKTTSETITNFLSVSDHCLNEPEKKPMGRQRSFNKTPSVQSKSNSLTTEDYNKKVQLWRKRQHYGQIVSTRNKTLMNEAKIMKDFAKFK